MGLSMDISPIELGKKTFKEFGADKVTNLAAALAYYAFTSFFPLLLVLISLVGIALSFGVSAAEGARDYVLNAVSSNLPAARDVIEQSFQETSQSGGTLGFIGLLTGLLTASGVFAQLDEAFNIIYDIVPRDKSWKDKIKARLQAASIVIFLALLLLGSLIFSTFLATAQGIVQSWPGGGVLAWGLNLGLSLVLTGGVFALLYKMVPDRPVTWKAAIWGGLITSVTWQIGREVLTWWLGRQGGVTAGTVVGSVLAFLVFIYYGAIIVLLGAEITATYDELANPDKIRHKTSSDSALKGPGQPADTVSGKSEAEAQGSAPRGSATAPSPSFRSDGMGGEIPAYMAAPGPQSGAEKVIINVLAMFMAVAVGVKALFGKHERPEG